MKNGTEKENIVKGAAVIALGGFIAKIVGALYRIPLTNLIGGEGIGLYQLVYPFYCLLLTVSATGIPSSIAKLTAERIERGESPRPLFSLAMKLFLIVGGASAVLMGALAPLLSWAQGEKALWGGYVALAPSVFLVSAISVLRGYFQGKNNMFPTAISEVVEQIVKVGLGVLFAYLFRGDLYFAVAMLLLAVTASESAALLFLWLRFLKEPPRLGNLGEKPTAKNVLSLSIPVTLSAGLLPLSGLIDSVLVVRLLKAYEQNAVALFGLFSGGAVTIINLPVSVCYGVAVASVPAIARAKANGQGTRKKLLYVTGLTLLLSLPCAVGLFLFAEPAVKIVFRSLRADELQTLTSLVKAFSVSAVTLSLTQTLAACLTALGKPSRAALSMGVAVAVKTVLNAVLVRSPRLSIYGAVIATSVCYFLSFSLDFFFALYHSKRKSP